MKILYKTFVLLTVAIFVFLPQILLAANPALDKLNSVATDNGPYQKTSQAVSLSDLVGVVVQAALALIGSVFLILMVYAGYNWMTARGEEEKVARARDTITRAFIGLIIVVGAYAIWSFVSARLF